MYHSSVWWVTQPTDEVSVKRSATKQQRGMQWKHILIRVNGFRWRDLRHSWSKDGVQYFNMTLCDHLIHEKGQMRQSQCTNWGLCWGTKRKNLELLDTSQEAENEKFFKVADGMWVVRACKWSNRHKKSTGNSDPSKWWYNWLLHLSILGVCEIGCKEGATVMSRCSCCSEDKQ